MKIYPHGTTIKDNQQLARHRHGGVGHRSVKVDALDKVLGKSRFTDDIKLPQMVFGKIVRSPHPHARIRGIDRSSVLHLPGVLDVIVGADLPKKYGIIPWTEDEYPLALHKANYVGDAVAAVIASSEYEAHDAASKLKVDYELLTPILNVDEAKRFSDIKVNENAKVGNITKQVSLSFGEVDSNFLASDVTLTENFSFHNSTHAPIEPHAALADYSLAGLLTLYSSTQVPHHLHRTLAKVLDLPSHRIRVIQPPVGGAFGGKSEPFDLEFVVALASMRLHRPVKILYTREEVFLAHRGRHPMTMTMSMGASKEGRILAVKNVIDIDGGAYASFGMITAFYAGQLLTGPTTMKSYHFSATRYYTNKPACGPKRGHGSVQPRFAFEIMCDMMAEKLGTDPIEFRKINALAENSSTINGQTINSFSFIETLDRVAEASGWYERRNKLPRGRGLGLASSMYISGTNYPIYPNDMPQSSVSLRIDRSGRITLYSGASEIGQGITSILAQMVEEELGVSSAHIGIILGDSDLCPTDLGAYSSRVTLMAGLAAQEALRRAKGVIAQAVADSFNLKFSSHLSLPLTAEAIAFYGGEIFYRDEPSMKLSFQEAVQIAESAHGALVFAGNYRTVARGGDYRGGTIGSSPAYSCTSHIADVTVDEETGRITINKIYVAHDCGRAINPDLVEGQIEGSTYMGAAEAWLENYVTDEEPGARRGMLIAPSLLDYRLPTSLDTPDIEAMIVEGPDQNGPYGAKEAGEGPLHSAIPAIANAIYQAVNIRLCSLPFSPSKVLAKLKQNAEKIGK